MERQNQFHMQPSAFGDGGTFSAVDEAFINGVYAGMSYNSLLTNGSFFPATETQNLLNILKTKPLFTTNDAVAAVAPLENLFSKSSTAFCSHHHHQLPNLRSLELPQYKTSRAESSRSFVTQSGRRDHWRRQRQSLSEKTRHLQKLLPWDKKMDMATVLEEAHKYIKFLQAQVRVLQSMPSESYGECTIQEIGGDLGRLSRQQLLQVVVNSPALQTMLYSRGHCVYSVEQLILFHMIAERKALFHGILFESDPNCLLS